MLVISSVMIMLFSQGLDFCHVTGTYWPDSTEFWAASIRLHSLIVLRNARRYSTFIMKVDYKVTWPLVTRHYFCSEIHVYKYVPLRALPWWQAVLPFKVQVNSCTECINSCLDETKCYLIYLNQADFIPPTKDIL